MNNNNNNNNNDMIGNGSVPQEFPQRRAHERLGEKPKKVADIPAIECCNWLLHRHYTRHEYKITSNLIDFHLEISNGHNEYANYLKGLILRREGRVQESLDCFRDSSTINCTNVCHVKQIAKSLFLLGDHKRAVDAYLEAGRMLNSNDWEMHHCLGECYLASHCSKQAMKELSKAVELTNDKIAHISLAKLTVSDNKIDQAIQIYKHIVQHCSDSIDAIIQLGFVYLKQNDILRAFQAFGTVLALSPGNIQAILPLAYIIQNHQEYDVALSKYKGTAQSLSESWQLWNNIGMCFCGKHKFVAAITCLKRAHYLNPMAWQSTYNLGRVLLMTGQYASAAIHFCAAIAVTSQNSMPYLLLGLTLKKLNDIHGAEQALFKAHSLTPREPIVLVNYAIVLQIQNKAVRVAEILSDLNDICTTMNVEPQIIQAVQQISCKINQIVDI